MEKECTPVSILRKLPTEALKHRRIATQTNKPQLIKRQFNRMLRYSSLGVRIIWICILTYIFVAAFFLVLFLGTAYTKEYKEWGIIGFNEFFLYPYRGLSGHYCITELKLSKLDGTTEKMLIMAVIFLVSSYLSLTYISGYGNKYIGILATAFLMGVLLSMAEFTKAYRAKSYVYSNLTQRNKLANTIKTKYLKMYSNEGTIGKLFWDVIFLEFGCCGVNGYKDMISIPGITKIKDYTRTTVYAHGKVPVTCCPARYDPEADRWWIYNFRCVWVKDHQYQKRRNEKWDPIHRIIGCFDKIVKFRWERYKLGLCNVDNWKQCNYSEFTLYEGTLQYPRKPWKSCNRIP